MGRSLGLKVNEEDVVELAEYLRQELTTDEVAELEHEQMKIILEEHSGEEEQVVKRVNVSSADKKEVCSKWSEVQAFIEKHHPNKTVTSRAVDSLNDNVVPFLENYLDCFLVQNTSH